MVYLLCITPVTYVAPVDPAEQVNQAVSIEIEQARIELIRVRKERCHRAEAWVGGRARVQEELDILLIGWYSDSGFTER